MKSMLAIVMLLVTLFTVTHAQTGDCNSGLLQHMSIGGRGWVIPEPPVSLRVRNTPNGEQIGSLEPGSEFTVVGGPECANNISWWQVESESIWGWVAEGVDYYFIEMHEEVQVQNALCPSEPSMFQVGDLVRLIVPLEQIDLYFGHPAIPNALFNTNLTSVGSSAFDYPWWGGMTDVLLTEGPYCVNEAYLWQIGAAAFPLQKIESTDRNTPFNYTVYSLPWVFERVINQSQFDLSPTQAEAAPAYEPRKITLRPPEAPIVAPDMQVAFGSQGGGLPFPGWHTDSRCGIAEKITVISSYFGECAVLYPFKPGEDVKITLRQPDGTVFSTINVQAVEISATANFRGENSDGRDAIFYTFGAVEIDLPDVLGTPTGVWMVEARAGDSTYTRAYRLAPELAPAYLWQHCEGAKPYLSLVGVDPEASLQFVSTELDVDTSTYMERLRWTLTVGEHGEMLIYPGFPLPAGLLVVADSSGDWRANVPTNIFFGNTGALARSSQWVCEVGYAPEEAIRLEYDDLATGELLQADANMTEAFYTFDGQAGDIITINIVGFGNSLGDGTITPDLQVLLESSNGELLANNDDAADPHYGSTDAEIRDFVLPKNGTYTIIVTLSPQEEFGGGYSIQLEGR